LSIGKLLPADEHFDLVQEGERRPVGVMVLVDDVVEIPECGGVPLEDDVLPRGIVEFLSQLPVQLPDPGFGIRSERVRRVVLRE
jgi:hypothetical protein